MCWWLAIVVALSACTAFAEERIADIRQGTNLSLALTPDGRTLVIDLLGQIWTLPATGGGAIPLTPTDEQSRQPRVSGDGTQVVYERSNGGQRDIWLLDLQSGERRPLVVSPYDEREPDFAADGRSIIFATNRGGRYRLASVTLAGDAERPLTDGGGDDSFPSVSEHGDVAYLERSAGEWSLRVLAANGENTRVHTSARRLSPPSWRPGGGVLVFAEQETAATSRLWMLLLADPPVLKPLSDPEDVFASRAAWTSGAQFLYAADGQLWRRGIATPTREPVHLFAASSIAVAAAPTDVGEIFAAGTRPAFGINGISRSSDGRRTVFTALGDIWLSERGVMQRLTDDAHVELDPALDADGDSIVFASERTGQFELWRLALPDRRLTQLTFGALQPRRPAVRADGKRVAYLASGNLEPWAETTLEILDLPNGHATIAATNVVGAEAVLWSDDGSTVRLQARSANLVGNLARLETSSGVPPVANGEATVRLRWQPPPPPADYVVEIGRLFDATRATYRRHVDMHVRGGRIAAVVGRGVLPSTGMVIDAREATVIPGLIDLHAHQSSWVGERLGRAWLAYGVTTVREIASNPGEALERAESWASGRSLGPRLVVTPSSAVAMPSGGGGPRPLRTFPGISQSFVHGLRRQGDELGVLELPPFPRRLILEPVRAGAEIELSPALAVYQDGVSRLLASGTTVVAGLAALGGSALWPNPRAVRDGAYGTLFTAAERAAWERPDGVTAIVPVLRETIGRLVRSGARIGIGSDTPAVPYGLGLHFELAAVAATGVANDQVLRMATIEGARALGMEAEIGTIEEGKLADFVVLEGDPLAGIEDTLRIVAVSKGGVWHARSELLEEP